jgi:hypothetical protein
MPNHYWFGCGNRWNGLCPLPFHSKKMLRMNGPDLARVGTLHLRPLESPTSVLLSVSEYWKSDVSIPVCANRGFSCGDEKELGDLRLCEIT